MLRPQQPSTGLLEYFVHASGILSPVEVKNTIINNLGQGIHDIFLTLPMCDPEFSFILQAGEPSTNRLRLVADAADDMIVDGVVGCSYAQFNAPNAGDFMIIHSAKTVSQPSGLLTSAGLAIGTTKTNVSNPIFTHYIGAVAYYQPANLAGSPLGSDVIPQDKYGAVALDINSEGTITVISARQNLTGYITESAAIADLPDPDSNNVRLGFVTVMRSTAAFTFGTTHLDDANSTVKIVDYDTYSPKYSWIITAGKGTITTDLAPM